LTTDGPFALKLHRCIGLGKYMTPIDFGSKGPKGKVTFILFVEMTMIVIIVVNK
jgi:hypothetical protein